MENSSFRVNWEQLEADDESRGSGSGSGVGSEPDLAPPAGSIPTTGRKPVRRQKRIEPQTGNRSILSREVEQTMRPLKVNQQLCYFE